MYLDERSKKLLVEIVKKPNTTNKKLQLDHKLTRRQVNYSLNKVNEWLEDQGFNALKKMNGYYRVDDNIGELLEIEKEDHEIYIPSPNERKYLIILYVLSRDEALSLNHFIVEMNVSKNTVLQDLKEVNKILDSLNLDIQYTRSEGYYTVGDEWDKRSLMLDAIYRIIHMHGGEYYLKKLMGISQEEVTEIRSRLNIIEQELTISFADTEMDTLPYSFYGLFKRMMQGKYINTEFFIDNYELSDTREFEAVKVLIEGKGMIPEEERLYLALQLLTSNTIKKTHLKVEELPKLKYALQKTLEEFERKAVINLIDKKTLVDKLFLHFKPAYYRIKYKLTTDYRPLEKVSEEFKMLHYFVKESLDPLKIFLKSELPESEIMFITLFVVGHILEHNEQNNFGAKKKAIVVCPNGLSISKLMKHNLQSLFPEIYFYPTMSIREFKKTTLPYDIVFSARPITVPLDKKLFVVNQMMEESERNELRKMVMKSVFHSENNQIEISKLMEIISEYTEVIDEQQLISNLKGVIQEDNKIMNSESDQKEVIHLPELINSSMIQIVDKVSNWKEAMEVAAQPLLEKKKISLNYLKALNNQYPVVSEHIVLQRNIAIPHAESEKGVKELGMSMLFIKEGIPNFDGSDLHFIVVIAATDRKSHFTALMELMKLAGNDALLKELSKSGNEDEIYQVILKLIKEKDPLYKSLRS